MHFGRFPYVRGGCFPYFASEVITLGKFTGHNTVKMCRYINITGVCEICESFTISLSTSSFFFTTYLPRRNADGVCLPFSFGGRIHCAYNVPAATLCLGLWAVFGSKALQRGPCCLGTARCLSCTYTGFKTNQTRYEYFLLPSVPQIK